MVIVSGSDTKFVPGVLILIYSAWLNNPDAQFYVIDAGISAKGRDRIDAFCRRHGIRCGLLKADPALLARLPVAIHWSQAVYARLLIPELLPQHSRAIYIDSDAVVTTSLSELWDLDLGDNLVAGCLDGMMDPAFLAGVGMRADEYVNSGVIVMDLDRWRAERVSEQAIAILDARPDLGYPDQTALNLVTRGRAKLLDRRFNFLAREITRFEKMTPSIVHYAGPDKPWANKRCPLSEIFEAYRIASGADIPEPPRGWEFKTFRRTVMGLLSLRPKYWRRVAFGRHYRAAFVDPHIAMVKSKAAALMR
ncbi:glycosyltransferase family 8 protein [Kaistia sp. MMO-174]|uniref:glycosyltransferase family 8 protein n=1 Tax=Kaistia sp. MMO-174 TaxID=3081256 RepID=UPI0030184C1E